jgi:hypothetical protein
MRRFRFLRKLLTQLLVLPFYKETAPHYSQDESGPKRRIRLEIELYRDGTENARPAAFEHFKNRLELEWLSDRKLMSVPEISANTG